VGKKIGCGNFGELRLGKNLYNNEHVAIKLGTALPFSPVADPIIAAISPHTANVNAGYQISGRMYGADRIPEFLLNIPYSNV
jgi:hypothetical protein